MDCPACGITNTPKALVCDCGYDFATQQRRAQAGWPVELSWGQRLAAYWSISWPASIVSFLAGMLYASRYPGEELAKHTIGIFFVGNSIFFACQAVLTGRIVRKRYRSFQVDAIRDTEQRERRLSARDTILVWVCLSAPQLAFIASITILLWWYGPKLPAETVRSLSSLGQSLRTLVEGPYAVGFALRAKYPGFRLQAYGYRI